MLKPDDMTFWIGKTIAVPPPRLPKVYTVGYPSGWSSKPSYNSRFLRIPDRAPFCGTLDRSLVSAARLCFSLPLSYSSDSPIEESLWLKEEGQLIVAVEEERFNRKKHCGRVLSPIDITV